MDLSIELQCHDPALLDQVMLDIAHSPVVALPGETADAAVKAHKTRGDKYLVEHPFVPAPVTAEELKVMRLRYILLNSRRIGDQSQLLQKHTARP